ncbi:MAG: hypothetical protein F6K26_33490 [Moorea sp. SIO2I5]|nr:hypothetical protein [Moorena sp. SIO2I5]
MYQNTQLFPGNFSRFPASDHSPLPIPDSRLPTPRSRLPQEFVTKIFKVCYNILFFVLKSNCGHKIHDKSQPNDLPRPKAGSWSP